MSKVSVVIAAYNHSHYVDACLDSVLAQTHPDLEVIVVDDASSDDTAAKLTQWQARFDASQTPFHLVINPENQGQYAALEHAISLARGEFLAVLNSDDAWHPEKLARQVQHLQSNPHHAAVFTHVQLIDAYNKKIAEHRYYPLFNNPTPPVNRFEWLRQFFLTGNSLCHPSVMIRTQVQHQIGSYDCRMGNTADHDYWVRLALHHEWAILPEPLTQFRLLPGEGNMGGQKPASRLRHAWERSQILTHFTQIPNRDTLQQIFPELPLPAQFAHPDWDVPYWLAQRAFMENRSLHDRFAMTVVHQQMADPAAVAYYKKQYQFGYPQWIALTGQKNPFAINMADKKQHRLSSIIRQIARIIPGSSR